MKTVKYGTTPASFLSVACLIKLPESEFNINPKACVALKRYFCVDDYISGAFTVKNAILLRNQLIFSLKSARFKYRKWSSNNSDLLRYMSNKKYICRFSTKKMIQKYDINNINQNKIIGKQQYYHQ